MALAYLGIGSNVGDKLKNIREMLLALEKTEGINIIKVSSLYCTSPVGPQDQDWFVNGAVLVETALGPSELLERILSIEKGLGRTRDRPWGPRTIDIDILFYEDMVFESDSLKIPHPEAHKRAFVLVPLSEIAGGFIHPVFRQSISELLESLKYEDEKLIYLGSLC